MKPRALQDGDGQTDNWKLLKFLCDRIEESKTNAASNTLNSANILAKRKNRKRKTRTLYPKPNGNTSKSAPSSALSLHTVKRHTHKNGKNGKKSALYTEAIKYRSGVSFSSRSSSHHHTKSMDVPINSKLIGLKSPRYPIGNEKIPSISFNTNNRHYHSHMHSKSIDNRSSQLIQTTPHQMDFSDAQTRPSRLEPRPYSYNVGQQMQPNAQLTLGLGSDSSASDRSELSPPFTPINHSHTPHNYKHSNNNNKIDHHLKISTQTPKNLKLDTPNLIQDPIQDLVTLVRRVTQKYMEEDDTKAADDATLQKIYDKYVETYRRTPMSAEHLRTFGNKFQGIHCTYAAAKSYMDSIRAIAQACSPKISMMPNMMKLRDSLASKSSPIVVAATPMDDDDENILATLNPKSPSNVSSDLDDEIANYFAYYNMTEIELLQHIKRKINLALKEADDIEGAIHMIWEREYSELEKRLHRLFLQPTLRPWTARQSRQVKNDSTFLQLKQMSHSTDVDDQDHDAAVFLLKTFFPDDEEYSDEITGVTPGGNRSREVSYSYSTRRSHLRSVTEVNDGSKPTFLRRQTEALSLYDEMVIKHRKKENNAKLGNMELASLKPTKSEPLGLKDRVSKSVGNTGKLKLKIINSNEDENDDDFSINGHESSKSMFTPYKLDENIQADITPDHPLFDPQFCQLTTSPSFSKNTLGATPSMSNLSKQSTGGMSYSETSEGIRDNDNDDEHKNEEYMLMEALNNNLLDTMSKYGDKMHDWDFNIFEFMDDPLLGNKGLVCLSFYLFRLTGILETTEIGQANLWRFLENVQNGYLDNPYHNKYHAVDVLLSTHYMFQSEFFKQHMTIWDQFATYIAAVCHDLGHMGFNNAWYVNTAGNLALLYGDESVLENYHISEAFRLLNKPVNNWMVCFPSSIRRYVSTVIRRTILATDLKVHGRTVVRLQNLVNKFKEAIGLTDDNKDTMDQHKEFCKLKLWKCESIASYASIDNIYDDGYPLYYDENKEFEKDVLVNDLELGGGGGSIEEASKLEMDSMNGGVFDEEKELSPKKPRIGQCDDERMFILEVTIHACDVANPCKPLYLAKQWADRYLTEAFNQGDSERSIGIPVSAGMDRFTSKLPTSQIGFITYIVKRLFELYSEVVDVAEHCVDIMKQNEQYWIEEKKKMIAIKNNNKKTRLLGTIQED